MRVRCKRLRGTNPYTCGRSGGNTEGSVDTVAYLAITSINIFLYIGMNPEPHFLDTSTRTGLDKLALCSFATLVVIVAENK